MNFAGFQQGFNGATNAQDVIQKLQDAQNQQQGNALLTKIIQQYAGANAPSPAPAGGPASVGAMAGPVPGMSPQTGGVSPPMQGPPMPPAMGGAPGGAGPSNPMGGASLPPSMPQTGAMGGIDMQRLMQALAGSGGSDGAQGYALKDAMKLLQPQANNALKLDLNTNNNNTRKGIADENNSTREDIAQKNIDARKSIADANRMVKNGGGPKLKDDAVYRALEDKLKAAQSANAANGTEDTYSALIKASDDLLEYARQKGTQTTPAADKPAATTNAPAARLQPVPVPPEAKDKPDGATATDEKGNVWKKQGDMMVPQ